MICSLLALGWVAMRSPLLPPLLPPPERARPVRSCAPKTDLDVELHGRACSPSIADGVLVRYMFDGGTLAQGRLCVLSPAADDAVQGVELLAALQRDGVDRASPTPRTRRSLERFYACAYWNDEDETVGAWLPVLPDVRDPAAAADDALADDVRIELVSAAAPRAAAERDEPGRKRTWSHAPRGAPRRRRVDVKLFRRAADSVDAAAADAAAGPGAGALGVGGYHAIGIVGAKNAQNVGTLWRSAFQLGAAFIFTVGTRYRSQTTDTLKTHWRMPLFELPDWHAFADFA
eukprot:4455558-Prymnesium_polylepis.1